MAAEIKAADPVPAVERRDANGGVDLAKRESGLSVPEAAAEHKASDAPIFESARQRRILRHGP